MIDDDDLAAFRHEMTGVTPLKGIRKVDRVAGKVAQPTLQHRRQMAVTVEQKSTNHLSDQIIDLVQPLDSLEYRSDGVSLGVFRNLKRGQYPIDARLDLHRKKMHEAREAVYRFIHDCQRYDIRSAIILHGKGELSEPKAFLKSCVNTWLKQIPEVIAFHSAQKHQGGVGALYVLIKKSERLKLENKLQINRGRDDADC